MNPALLGLLLVGAAATVGIVLAARSGQLAQWLKRPKQPPLDLTNPLVRALSAELRALDAMPISTKEERRAWSEMADVFEKRLRTDWTSIYDSLPHEVEHYLNDLELRAKDAGYASFQRQLLAALLTPDQGAPA